jgi:PTS system N-acetylglucosamine-specific IIC component
MAKDTIELVGAENIKEIDNCITRVRLTVKDNSKLSRDAAQKINYQGYVKTGKTQAHFIIGPESEIIANEMRRILKR